MFQTFARAIASNLNLSKLFKCSRDNNVPEGMLNFRQSFIDYLKAVEALQIKNIKHGGPIPEALER